MMGKFSAPCGIVFLSCPYDVGDDDFYYYFESLHYVFSSRVVPKTGWFLKGDSFIPLPPYFPPRATCFELRGAVAVMLARWLDGSML